MKAIQIHQFGEPEVLRYEEVPEPRPKEGEVLVEVKAAGGGNSLFELLWLQFAF